MKIPLSLLPKHSGRKRSRTAGKRPEGNPEASQAIRDTAAKKQEPTRPAVLLPHPGISVSS